MSDTPKLDLEERQRAQQVYEECCENPEDFAYKYVALQSELAAAHEQLRNIRNECEANIELSLSQARKALAEKDKRIAELEESRALLATECREWREEAMAAREKEEK